MRALMLMVAIALAAAAASASARAPEHRDIAALRWRGAGTSADAGEAVAKRDGRWMLIVVDARRRSSEMLLDEFRRNGYEGRDAVVLVVGDAASASAFARRTGLLPQARWQWAPIEPALRELHLPGTPVVLGIDTGTHIAWQESGMSRRPGDIAVRIVDWIAPKPAPSGAPQP